MDGTTTATPPRSQSSPEQVEGLQEIARDHERERNAMRATLSQVQAEAAAMREALVQRHHDGMGPGCESGYYVDVDDPLKGRKSCDCGADEHNAKVRHALSSDAGTSLLRERDELRASVEKMRAWWESATAERDALAKRVALADAVFSLGRRGYLCKFAFEPLQEGETYQRRVNTYCCDFCKAFAGYMSTITHGGDTK